MSSQIQQWQQMVECAERGLAQLLVLSERDPDQARTRHIPFTWSSLRLILCGLRNTAHFEHRKIQSRGRELAKLVVDWEHSRKISPYYYAPQPEELLGTLRELVKLSSRVSIVDDSDSS